MSKESTWFIKFPGYSPGQPPTHAAASEISNYELIEYNGNYGSVVTLKNGHTFRTSMYPCDITRALRGEGE